MFDERQDYVLQALEVACKLRKKEEDSFIKLEKALDSTVTHRVQKKMTYEQAIALEEEKKRKVQLVQRALPQQGLIKFWSLDKREKAKRPSNFNNTTDEETVSELVEVEMPKNEKEIELDFMARNLLDLNNTVESFEEFGMLTPSGDIQAAEDLVISYKKAYDHIKKHTFEESLYPAKVMQEASNN